MFTVKDVLNYADCGIGSQRFVIRRENRDEVDWFRLKDSAVPQIGPENERYSLVATSNLWTRGITKALQSENLPAERNDVISAMIEYLPVMNAFEEQILNSMESGKPLSELQIPKEFEGKTIATYLQQSFSQKPYCLEVLAEESLKTYDQDKTKSYDIKAEKTDAGYVITNNTNEKTVTKEPETPNL